MAQYGIGVSALNAFSEAIDVTSNNIANAQTIGYKGADYVFADQFFRAQNPQSKDRSGMGVSRMTIRRANTYGTITGTQNPLDLAVAGPGLFMLAKQVDGTVPTENPQKFQYTRNGQFAVDSQNRIVNQNGLFLVGYAADGNGKIIETSKSVLKMDNSPLGQQATIKSDIELNLDARVATITGGVFDKNNVTTYSQTTSQTVYDSKGQSHTLSMYYKKVNSADLVLTQNVVANTFTFEPKQSLGTTLNGEQFNNIANTSMPATVTGPIQTINNAVLTYTGGGSESLTGIKSAAITTAGTGYRPGIYKNVSLGTGGAGSGALATVRINSDGTLGSIEITNTGTGYAAGNTLTLANTQIGGVGTGIALTNIAAGNIVGGNTATLVKTEGNATTTESNVATFPNDLVAGDQITIGGLTLTANGAITKENAAAAFANVLNGRSGNFVANGAFSGTLTGWSTGNVANGNTVTFTSATTNTNVTDLTVTNKIGKGFLGATYSLNLSDGTNLAIKQISVGGGTPQYIVEADRFQVYATLDGTPIGKEAAGTGLSTIKLNGVDASEQTSLGTMAFVGGKNIDSLSRDQFGKPQFITRFNIDASGGAGTSWGKTANGGIVQFTLDSTDTTAYSSAAQTYKNNQDGSQTSQLTNYSFDRDGKLLATYDNGKSIVKGQLLLATFNNFEGLIPVGENGFQASSASGEPLLDKPNSSQLGAIRSQALEESNVDLTQQLVKLMVLQRAYSAASQATKIQVATLVDDTLRIGA
jgi:flagellar hook-basal body protein